MNIKITKPRIRILIYFLSAFMFLFCLVRGYVLSDRQVRNTICSVDACASSHGLVPLNEGWILHTSGNETASISLPCDVKRSETGIRITHDVTGLFHTGDILKFDNLRQGLRVFADDRLIYEVNTTALVHQLSFTDYQLVAIPDAETLHQLSIEFTSAYGETFSLPEIIYGDYVSARNEIVTNDLITIIVLAILAILFVAILLVCVYAKLINFWDTRILDLGVFVLTAIFWGFTDSYLPVLTDIPQEVLGLVCYLSLMALPLPMCQFVWESCKRKYRILPIISTIGSLNLILNAVLSTFGVIQLQNTFYSAHVLILMVIVSSLICIYRHRKNEKTREMGIIYWGIVLLALMSLLSLTMFWIRGGVYYRIGMLIGILIFSVILCVYVVYHYSAKIKADQLKLSEIRLHEQLATIDSLTGLPNRRAFEAKLAEVEQAGDALSDAVLIMLDVNGLKMVNDQFGHSAGDDLIVSAARVIQQTFGANGSNFRIGGDEFVVILTDTSMPLTLLEAMFEKNIDKANEGMLWKLSIARGISHLTKASGQRLTISDWKQEADVNMYRNKISMTGGRTRDRANDFAEIIKCIVSTIEAKDMYTAAHSDRVRELSLCIGNELGLSGPTLMNLETAAHLHDIGKIGVPDYVLQKNSRLTKEEYEIIQKHSTIGAGIIGQAKGMYEIADVVLHHHEHWDGTGYPEGLYQEEIPLESRVIAIADSIDAMTSKRVYRDSMSLDECRKEIELKSGIFYDPAIVRIVLQNWKKIVDTVLLHPKHLYDADKNHQSGQ